MTRLEELGAAEADLWDQWRDAVYLESAAFHREGHWRDWAAAYRAEYAARRRYHAALDAFLLCAIASGVK